MAKTIFILLLVLCFGFTVGPTANADNFPEILDIFPKRLYQVLGPVGADGDEVSQARQRLLVEAKKMAADAVVGVRCETGGIKRQGLSWSKVRAYCRGTAIGYTEGQGPESRPASPSQVQRIGS